MSTRVHNMTVSHREGKIVLTLTTVHDVGDVLHFDARRRGGDNWEEHKVKVLSRSRNGERWDYEVASAWD